MRDEAPPADAPEQDRARATSAATRLRTLLTRAQPAHLVQYREEARTVMILVALLAVLASLWMPHPVDFSRASVLPLLAAMAVFLLASATPALHLWLNRFGGLVLLVMVYLLVGLTGGERSIYIPFYLVLLVYAAMFYDRHRLVVTYVLISLAMLVPGLHTVDLHVVQFSTLLVELIAWGLVALMAHALMHRLRTASTTDGLTGLTNHATFWHLLDEEHERTRRYGGHYSVVLIDIDHFNPDPPLRLDRRRPAERANALLPGTMTLLRGQKSPSRRAPAECEQTTS